MATQTLHVPGISCQHCARRITQALQTIAGVQAVRVDVENRQVELTYEGADTLGRVRAVLHGIGYPPER